MNSSYHMLVFFLFSARILSACEPFYFISDSGNRWVNVVGVKSLDGLGTLSGCRDVVLDYCNDIGIAKASSDTCNIMFSAPGEGVVKNILLRNFCNHKNKKSIPAVLKGSSAVRKLKVRGDITRELGALEGTFNFGGSSPIPYMGAAPEMEIEVEGDVNVGSVRGNPLFKGCLSFGEWENFGNSGYIGPSRVLVRGDVNIFGLGELRCGVGKLLPKNDFCAWMRRADFEVLGGVNMVAFDVSYPTWILSNRIGGGASGVFKTLVRIGGLNGMGLVMNNARNAISTLVISNPDGVVGNFKGRIQDDSLIGGDSRICIVKEGGGTQYLEKNFGKKRFTGGLEVREGEIYLNSTESIGNLSLVGGMVGTLPCGEPCGANSVLTVSDFCWSGGTVAVRLYGGGMGSEIKVCGDFKVCDEMKFEFILKNCALSYEYRILKWNTRPDLAGKNISHNNLGNIFPVFESREDGLYVSFREK